jgi:four helix bundle protein
LNFFNIAKSSLAEVGYCIHVAQRLGYITEAAANELESEIKRVGAPLAGLIASTRREIGVRVVGATVVLCYLAARLA